MKKASALLGRSYRRRLGKTGLTLAAIIREKCNELVHRLVVGRVVDEAAFLSPANEANTTQMCKVERQSWRWHPELLAYSAGVFAFGAGLDEQAEDGKAGIVT